MKTTIEINRPYVHGSVHISWVGEIKSRLHVFADSLSVNGVPVIIEGVLARGRLDVWSVESFSVRRLQPRPSAKVTRHGAGHKVSRRNHERTQEEILRAVVLWAGDRHEEHRPANVIVEEPGDLAELLGAW
jgi:hypothetical protein